LYLNHFGLDETPFAITPDPAFVYLSARHRDALAHLLYGVGQGGSGGFVQLTGEVGTGKTTLCRCMLEQVPEGTRIALIINPLVTAAELLAAICEELGVEVVASKPGSKEYFDALSRYLLEAHQAGARVVVVIDEAQNLSPEALEQVRLLTNLETSKDKLLQIVLLGQPELRELLQRRSLRQLAQRVTARYHLTPLGARDTALYVEHRMRVAGAQRNPFENSAVRALFQRSHGVPRLINIIADRALLGAYARERTAVDARLIHAAADEVQLGEPGARGRRWPWVAGVAALLAIAVTVGLTPPGADPDSAPPLVDAQAATPGDLVASRPRLPAARVNADEVPESVSNPESLDAAWLETQSAAAWQGLATIWGDSARARAVQSACAGVPGTGYACIRDQGNWSRLQQLGFPVVLELSGPSERHLLLRGLNQGSVLVGAPATSRSVPRTLLEEFWFGTYHVAWPQSPNWPRTVRRGDSGPAVQTILSMARSAEPPYAGPAGFGVEFEDWLRSFQQRHGLDRDGIVGPKTLLYLMRPTVNEPVLLSQWPGRP
jgi:general secretion pathway protein A